MARAPDLVEGFAYALTDLATGKTWSYPRTLSANQATSWNWKADGTVCMWTGSPSGKCSDDGTWKIVEKRICYRLTWWLKSEDMTSACFSVVDLGKGSDEAQLPCGTAFLTFRVSPSYCPPTTDCYMIFRSRGPNLTDLSLSIADAQTGLREDRHWLGHDRRHLAVAIRPVERAASIARSIPF